MVVTQVLRLGAYVVAPEKPVLQFAGCLFEPCLAVAFLLFFRLSGENAVAVFDGPTVVFADAGDAVAQVGPVAGAQRIVAAHVVHDGRPHAVSGEEIVVTQFIQRMEAAAEEVVFQSQ